MGQMDGFHRRGILNCALSSCSSRKQQSILLARILSEPQLDTKTHSIPFPQEKQLTRCHFFSKADGQMTK